MSKDYGSYGHRSGSSHRHKDYSPYQQHQGTQRPSSAGVSRTRRSSSGATGGNAMNYARATQGNVQHGMNYMQTPVINTALLGSGYGIQGQQTRGNVRPSSAGHSRASGGQHHLHNQGNDGHRHQQAPIEMPALNSSGGGSSSRGNYMRPKSAGVVRQSSNSDGQGSNAMQQQQMYYQQHIAQQQI